MLYSILKLSLVTDIKDCLMYLRAVVAFLAASAHCFDGFRSFVMMMPRSFSSCTTFSSCRLRSEVMLYVVGSVLPICMDLHFFHVKLQKPVLRPLCQCQSVQVLLQRDCVSWVPDGSPYLGVICT